MYKAGINYNFPFVYPDWGFGNIVYFLRIRANIFYDFTQAKSLRTGNHYNFTSIGAEIFFDTKWWNQQPVTFGIRYSRLLDIELREQHQINGAIVLPLKSLTYFLRLKFSKFFSCIPISLRSQIYGETTTD